MTRGESQMAREMIVAKLLNALNEFPSFEKRHQWKLLLIAIFDYNNCIYFEKGFENEIQRVKNLSESDQLLRG